MKDLALIFEILNTVKLLKIEPVCNRILHQTEKFYGPNKNNTIDAVITTKTKTCLKWDDFPDASNSL